MNKDLKFKIPSVQITETDSLEIREKILNMSPEQRKQLGINKTTLWYQKKKLAKGNKIKVYTKVLSRLRQ